MEKAFNFPLSGGKCVVDSERVQEIVDDIRLNLPQEIRQARAIVADRGDIIATARQEGEGIVRAAEERARSLVAQEEITKQAQQKATEILSQDVYKRQPSVQGDVLVESVTIQNRVDRLLEGETAQLTSEVLPEDATNKNVTWSSSDESVLTVSQDGLVQAVCAGTATIKASAQTEDMIFDTCKIKVVAKPIFKTDKDTYEPNETILVTDQTDYNVASVILKDEAGNEINRIHVQSSINGDYKEWNIKVSMAEAGHHFGIGQDNRGL